MTWSYDTTLPTSKDKVRLRIHDTDTASQEFSDEEITAVLNDVAGDVVQAALRLAKSMAFKYAKKARNMKAGPYAEDTTKRAEMFKALAMELADEADEPWEEIAEFTPDGPSAERFIHREDVRDGI